MSRGLWLDHAQHHLHGDSGIDRRAAAPQNFEARFDRERMRGRHHLLRLRARRLDPADEQQANQDGERTQRLHARRATMKIRRNGKSVMPSARVG